MDVMQHFLPLLCCVECNACNVCDLVFVVFKVFDNVAFTLCVYSHLFLAKVQPADEFADDDHVYTIISNDFRLERREMSKALGQVNWAKVRECVEAATQWKQGAALWLHIDGNFFRFLVIEPDRAF